MVYLIGVDHLVQYNGPVPVSILENFKGYLLEIISRFSIKVIAEEFNDEFLWDVLGATEDTAISVAAKAGIEHIYCDPDERERLELGIPYFADVKESVKLKNGITEGFILDDCTRRKIELETFREVKKFWAVREQFWLNRIKERFHENLLFICGHEHVHGFNGLLRRNGAETHIIDEFWERGIFSDYEKIGLR